MGEGIYYMFSNSQHEEYYLNYVDTTPRNWKKTLRLYYFSKRKTPTSMTIGEVKEIPFKFNVIENHRSHLLLLKRS